MSVLRSLLVLLVLSALLWAGLAAPPPCPCSSPALCKRITTEGRREVLAFSLYYGDWEYYDWNRVTTVALFQDTIPAQAMCVGHSHGAKVVINGNFPVKNLTNAVQRQQWITNTLQLVKDNYLDGVNIDIESAIPDQSPEQSALNTFVQEVHDAFKTQLPGSQVTFDVAWSPNCIDGRCYDAVALSKYTDFLVIMAYDLRSQIFPPKACIASANSPFPLVKEGIQGYLNLGIPPQKLVLGLPWYGYDYPCQNPTNETVCPIIPVPFRGAPCSDAAGREKDYGVVMGLLKSNSTTGRRWDPALMAPWFNYIDAQTGVPHQIWYDDVESLSAKYKMARGYSLRGLAFWTADSLDYSHGLSAESTAMWRALDAFFL